MIKEFQGEFRWLSNFASCKINFEGFVFESTENAYQAAKCKYKEDMEQFVTLTPGNAKRRAKKIAIREDWDNVKLQIMEELLVQKFNQEPFKTNLINTGDEFIQEGNTWNDVFWGVNLKTGFGENNLGKLIMKIREGINAERK